MDIMDTPEDIENIVNPTNPTALQAHRIGTSTAVIMLFDDAKVPNYIKCVLPSRFPGAAELYVACRKHS